MGKIIDIMISMTQIMSPLIEYHLIIGITILLFILNNINSYHLFVVKFVIVFI